MKTQKNRIIEAAKQALVSTGCDHDCEEIHDPRKPWGFEAWSCREAMMLVSPDGNLTREEAVSIWAANFGERNEY